MTPITTTDTTTLIARRLRALRAAKGWSQADLSRHVDLSPGYIARLEMSRHDPSCSTMTMLADAFGLTLAEFVTEADTPTRGRKSAPRG